MKARGLQERQRRVAIYSRQFWDQFVLQSHTPAWYDIGIADTTSCPVQLHHTASSRSKQLVQAHLLMQSHLDSTFQAGTRHHQRVTPDNVSTSCETAIGV
jgi:hypothetical protein